MTLLWAPWRMAYIVGEERAGGCIFCAASAEGPRNDARNLILARRRHAFVMLNRYPYAYGHLLVAPRSHVGSVAELAPAEHDAFWRLVTDSVGALDVAVRPHGINVGLNFGRAAGAGIEDHVHAHLVPRWVGDTNFMPLMADVRVMPEHLEGTRERLLGAFAPLAEPAGDDSPAGGKRDP